MIKFFRLLEFEFGRLLKFLIPAFILSVAMQFFTLFLTVSTYNDFLNYSLETNSPMENFSMHNVTGSGLFPLAILIVPLLFVFYSLFTWYREWLGKNTFIYRLLMLPIDRMSIFYAKAMTFILGGLLTFVAQFGLYGILSFVLKSFIEPEHFTQYPIHDMVPPYEFIQQTLFPTTGFDFLHTYGFAIAALFVFFTAILIERSFNFKGAIVGLAYFIVYFVGYFSFNALYYATSLPWIVRPSHIFLLQSIYILLMIVISSLISRLLLKNKVRV